MEQRILVGAWAGRELEEQPALRFLTNVVGCAPNEIAIYMPVEVEFVEREPAFVPVFRPRSVPAPH